MSNNRFAEWLSSRGWEGTLPRVVLVQKTIDGVRLELEHPSLNDGTLCEELAQSLSAEWHVPVTVAEVKRPLVERVRDVIGKDQPALLRLLDAHSIVGDDREMQLTFPNKVAETLFRKWGGVPKLKQALPELKPTSIEIRIAEQAPPAPDQPVAVALSHNDAEPARIGRPPDPDRVQPLASLPASGTVVVAGRVFARDVRDGHDRLRHWTWSISDEVSALRLKYSERRGGPKLAEGLFSPGTWLIAEGILEMDKFSGETVLRVKNAAATESPSVWPAISHPRIELHAHTKMSAMDGLNATRDLFREAQKAGIAALAVTDHGVVQAYPEAEAASQSSAVRALYGVEAYMVDTETQWLTGPADAAWRRAPLVVVDVETTGLSPRSHQVLELGAVKIEDGTVTDTFHRLIRPSRSISEATQRITGITADDLKDGVGEAEVWPEFFAFAGGAVLAAHNARFDLGFLRAAWERFMPTVDFNPVVLDTLALARAVTEGVKSHGLSVLSQHYKIPLSNHHRALADAEATGLLALKLLADLDAHYPDWHPGQPLAVSHLVGRPTPVMLLVKDQAGLDEFYRLISASHLRYFHRVPRLPRTLIDAGRQHWFVGAPFHDGEVAEALFRRADSQELERISAFYDYFEVVPPAGCASWQAEGWLDGEEALIALVRDVIDLGRRHDKWVAAVSDAHYLRAPHKIYRDILAATAKGELHNNQDMLCLWTWEEMNQAFSFLDESDRRWVIDDAPAAIVAALEPIQPVPSGLFSPKLAQAESVVAELPYRRARELYGDPLPDIVQARLDKEIQSIVTHGFSSIYYTAHRLVQKSLEDGYLVGSRGSVGSSLVATLLDITEVNPLPPHYRCPTCRRTTFVMDGSVGSGFDLPARNCDACGTTLVGDGQDIPFETFLGFEGDKVPDIDLNFSGDYQSEIHRYTEVLFGPGHVFRAGTIATIADKTAFGLVKAWARDQGREPTPAEIEWLASALTGVKRTTGQHPGGLMVVPEDEDIHHFTPVQHPADDKGSDVVTTHFDYHSIEGRLLKLDLLGHDDPTAIRMLEELTGITARDVPFQDAETMSLFNGVAALGVKPEEIGTPVGSLGIPEFGTRFVRQMLVDTRPKTFAELVRISGLSHGTEVWTNNAQDLIRQGTATLSEVIATRDDIMTYLLSRGMPPKTAFGISEAVRKGRGLTTEMASAMRKHGVPDWYIESCGHISYLFPKAHAAAYVMMGWRIAWYKVHQPLAYYATYFSVRAGDFDADTVLGGIKRVNQALAAIEEKGVQATPKEKTLVTVLELAREMLARGFRFQSIDLERSHATRFLIEGSSLIIPFAALPGLGVSAAQHIIEAREQSPFLSVDDLRQRAHLSKSVIELLRQHGALQGLGETSQLGFF